MGVYCDDGQSDEVWQFLANFGVKEKKWVYERDLIQKWMPSGVFMERWITAHGLKDTEAGKLREEARCKY